MRAKLITVAVYLGLCFLMFSCVEGEFYEKEQLEETIEQEFGEQESELNSESISNDQDNQADIQAEIEFQADINISGNIIINRNRGNNQSAGDTVVYTTAEGVPVIIADSGNNNNETGESELEDLLDQDVVNSSDNDNTNVGDESLPSDLQGVDNTTTIDREVANEGSQGQTNQSEENNQESNNTSTSEDSSGDSESNDDGATPDIITEITEIDANATEVADPRPSRERPSQERPSQEGQDEDQSGSGDNGNISEMVDNSDGGDDSNNSGSDTTTDTGNDSSTNSNDDSNDFGTGTTTDTGTDTTADSGNDSSNNTNGDSNNSGSETSTDNGSETTANTGNGGSTNGNNGGSTSNEEDNQSASEDGEEDGDFVTIPDENLDFVEDVEDGVRGDQFICNPFEGENQTSFQGIAGFVYDGLSQPFRSVQDYYDFGKRSDSPIFMSEINVPTRRFSEGFEINNGQLVLNDMGGKLFEYFALDLRGRIRLGELEEAGHYQFAILSDDGSIFQIDMDDKKDHELINNDRYTPTRMKCATEPVYFDKNTKRDFQMKYFQGPRMHIALMLLWRKVDPENMPHEELCDRGGNKLFFDYNKVPSEPRTAFLDLQERGWKVLDSQNYLLPQGLVENPCGDDYQEPQVQCFSEQVVLDGRNWFYFNNDGVDMSTVNIEDEYGNEIRYKYKKRAEKIKLRRRCGYGSKFRISYCMGQQ